MTWCQLYAFDLLALDGDDLHALPLPMRKQNPARCGPDTSEVKPSGYFSFSGGSNALTHVAGRKEHLSARSSAGEKSHA